ncbi:MAG: hypothetical protein KKA73_28710 [Chloroflexi bacterium]|nr:hypothetical protein [Chloroflexota bacterium]MBU1751676.1 hypothetical protein [Chloroflexota bacterium]
MGAWTKLSREAQLAILAAAIASGSTLACSVCRPFIICDPPPPTPTLMICDPPPPSPTQTPDRLPTLTPVPTPSIIICDPPPPSPTPVADASRPPTLPLAHRREARVVQLGPRTLDFGVECPAPGGDVQWTVTGGALAALPGGGVRWEPADQPGRYLLQATVDWGTDGLAVDSRVLTVTEEGAITVG